MGVPDGGGRRLEAGAWRRTAELGGAGGRLRAAPWADVLLHNLADNLLVIDADRHRDLDGHWPLDGIRAGHVNRNIHLLRNRLGDWTVNGANNGHRDRNIHGLVDGVWPAHLIGHVNSPLHGVRARNIERPVHWDGDSVLDRHRVRARDVDDLLNRVRAIHRCGNGHTDRHLVGLGNINNPRDGERDIHMLRHMHRVRLGHRVRPGNSLHHLVRSRHGTWHRVRARDVHNPLHRIWLRNSIRHADRHRHRVRARNVHHSLHWDGHRDVHDPLHRGGHRHLNRHTARHRHRVRARDIVRAVDCANHGVRLWDVHEPGDDLRDRNRLVDFVGGWNAALHHTRNDNLVGDTLDHRVGLGDINGHVNLNGHRPLNGVRARAGDVDGDGARNHTLHGNGDGDLDMLREGLGHCHLLGHGVWAGPGNGDWVLSSNLNNLLHNGNLDSAMHFLHTLSNKLPASWARSGVPVCLGEIPVSWTRKSWGRSGVSVCLGTRESHGLAEENNARAATASKNKRCQAFMTQFPGKDISLDQKRGDFSLLRQDEEGPKSSF